MSDIVSSEQRSKNMSAIRSRNTKPEIYIRKVLYNNGYRYRVNYGAIVGHPDVFIMKYNTAVFVNGCFWHRHQNCKYAYNPNSNIEKWMKKFSENVRRDKRVYDTLLKDGIKTIVIWECSIRKMEKDKTFIKQVVESINAFLIGGDLYLEI